MIEFFNSGGDAVGQTRDGFQKGGCIVDNLFIAKFVVKSKNI